MNGFHRRGFIAAALSLPALPALPARASELPLVLTGTAVQSGAVIGRTVPGADYLVDGISLGRASARGFFIVGFDRDAPETVMIAARTADGYAEQQIAVARAEYDVQAIDGLPQQTVTPEGEEVLARIAAEAVRKRAGFASNIDADWFAEGFTPPLADFRLSGRFGGQRILNGTPSTPHYGADMAAPLGTPILAPAPGAVCFAETGLHFEGGLVLIDHGQGLVSAYLHMSSVNVANGDMVARGQTIGNVGAEGRATGPHLCWRLKWRGRNLDPTRLLDVSTPQQNVARETGP